jgi:hypothetical protein
MFNVNVNPDWRLLDAERSAKRQAACIQLASLKSRELLKWLRWVQNSPATRRKRVSRTSETGDTGGGICARLGVKKPGTLRSGEGGQLLRCDTDSNAVWVRYSIASVPRISLCLRQPIQGE